MKTDLIMCICLTKFRKRTPVAVKLNADTDKILNIEQIVPHQASINVPIDDLLGTRLDIISVHGRWVSIFDAVICNGFLIYVEKDFDFDIVMKHLDSIKHLDSREDMMTVLRMVE